MKIITTVTIEIESKFLISLLSTSIYDYSDWRYWLTLLWLQVSAAETMIVNVKPVGEITAAIAAYLKTLMHHDKISYTEIHQLFSCLGLLKLHYVEM